MVYVYYEQCAIWYSTIIYYKITSGFLGCYGALIMPQLPQKPARNFIIYYDYDRMSYGALYVVNI